MSDNEGAWRRVTLGDVCTTSAGGTPNRSDPLAYGGEIPWVKSGEVASSDIWTTEERITTHGMHTSAAKMVDAGSVLIAMYGATAGQVARLKIPATTNQAVLAIGPKDGVLCSDFLYHYLRQAKNDLIATCQGSGQPNLNAGIVKGLGIDLPSLPEQKKISEILSGIDTATKRIEAKIKKLKLIKTSVCQKEFPYDAYFSEKGNGDKVSPQISNLRDVANVVDCKHRTPVYTDKGFPVVRPRDVKESGIDFNQCIKTSASELDSLNDGINPRVNDIVYSRNATLGVGALIESDTTFAIGQDVCILRSTGINPRYFYYQLNSDSFFAQVENLVSGSTFKRINLGAIRGLGVITPSTSEQSRVANVLDHIDNSIFLLQRRRDKYIQLKKSLASDLLSGRQRVSI